MRNSLKFKKYLGGIFSIGTLIMTVASWGQTVGPSPLTPYQPPQPPPAAVLESLRTAVQPPLLLRKDDVVSIKVFDLPELADKQRINESGTISIPFIGAIPAAGLTLLDVQQEITDQLVVRRLIKSPQVIVSGESLPSRTIATTGEFQKPGVFPAFGALRVADCVALAQGFTTTASRGVLLRRSTLPEPVYIPLGPDAATSRYADIPVFPGDSLEAPRAGVVYAVGAFKSQGAFPMKSGTPTTAAQVIALAGGVGYEGDLNDAQILRVRDGKYVLVAIPLDKIIKGKHEDIALESDDVLFVPSNKLKAAIKAGGANLVVSLATSFLFFSR